MRLALCSLVAGGFLACAPDPALGTFNFSLAGTETQTSPGNDTSTTTGTGTMAVTAGKSVDYILSISQVDATPCILELDFNDKRDAINFVAGQKCTFAYAGGNVTATFNTGSLTTTEKGETITATATYSYAGTFLGFNYAGTGMRTYSGTRR